MNNKLTRFLNRIPSFRALRDLNHQKKIVKALVSSDMPLHSYRLDGKFHREDYAVVHCYHCHEDQVIYSRGLSRCQTCGSVLVPCNACSECIYAACPHEAVFENFPRLSAKLTVNEFVSGFETDRVMRLALAEEAERNEKNKDLPF